MTIVDRRHHPVGLFEHVIGQVETAIFQDIQFHSFQKRDAVNLAGELINGPPMLPQPARIQPAGHSDPLGVIGNGDALSSDRTGGLGIAPGRGFKNGRTARRLFAQSARVGYTSRIMDRISAR